MKPVFVKRWSHGCLLMQEKNGKNLHEVGSVPPTVYDEEQMKFRQAIYVTLDVRLIRYLGSSPDRVEL